MVKRYLLKQRQELIEQRIDCSNSLKECDLKIKENDELIFLIENSKDESYESFAPFWSYNSSNEEKVKELNLERKKLEEKRGELLLKLDCVNQKIEELDRVIKAVQELQESKDEGSEKEEDTCQQELWLETLGTQDTDKHQQMQELTSVLHRLELCIKLLEIDPNRCKLELQALSHTVKNAIQDLQKTTHDLWPMSQDEIDV